MPISATNTDLSSYQALFGGDARRDAPGAPAQRQPRVIEDRVDLTTRARSYQQWPGAAPEGSPFHGQRTSAGLALDENGRAVVLDPSGRTVLIKTANGRQIQQWADALNDTSGRVSDLDKAKAYNALMRAWQDGNTEFSQDEKRAAAGVANNSVFAVQIEALNERTARMLDSAPARDDAGYDAEMAGLRGWITYYDSLQPWEQEIYTGSRESAEALLSFFEQLAEQERAGAHRPGDANPQDPKTRWLLSLYDRIGTAQAEVWKTGSLEALRAVRDALKAGFDAAAPKA